MTPKELCQRVALRDIAHQTKHVATRIEGELLPYIKQIEGRVARTGGLKTIIEAEAILKETNTSSTCSWEESIEFAPIARETAPMKISPHRQHHGLYTQVAEVIGKHLIKGLC